LTRIVSVETWVCRRDDAPGTGADTGVARVRSSTHGSEFVVLRLRTDDGGEGIATSISHTTSISRAYLDDVIAPVLLGRDVHDREAIWQELYQLNRRIVFFPVFLPGPVDVALWDVAARAAGLPLYRYLGGFRDRVPAYASSQFMAGVEDYLVEAARYRDLGVRGYKAHPGGDWRRHIEIAEALRAGFPEMTLMLDPAGVDYSLTQAVKVGRALEALDFHWLEEPFHDQFIDKYVSLTQTLDISIAATEATYGGPAGVAQFIRAGACDIVRADVAWKWGVTGTMKIAHLAEAFGLHCELTNAFSVMNVANLHVACAISNCEFYELYTPHEKWHFPLRTGLLLDGAGDVRVPDGPGLGVEIDWDLVDDTTRVYHEVS
jgi:L-alanine-DL-glutamate epimerase-like enolase superfamily enzyme